jgi:hypothetical protein
LVVIEKSTPERPMTKEGRELSPIELLYNAIVSLAGQHQIEASELCCIWFFLRLPWLFPVISFLFVFVRTEICRGCTLKPACMHNINIARDVIVVSPKISVYAICTR